MTFEGVLDDNGNASGAFLKIIIKEADLMIGMLSKNYNRTKYISFTSAIIFNPIVLLIPPGAPFSAFEKLFQPFESTVWIYLLVSLLIGFILIALLTLHPNNKLKRHLIGREIKMPAMDMIVGIVGGSQPVLPRKSSARIILMSFLLFCLIKRTLFTAALYQFLQSDIGKPPLSTLDDIVDKKFVVYYYPGFDSVAKNFRFYKL